MIEPIKNQLIQNINKEVAKAKSRQFESDEKHRKMQNEAENKGNHIDTFA